MEKRQYDEKKAVGASYIIEFARSVMGLTGSYANYLNFMIYLENKLGKKASDSTLGDSERNQFIEVIQNVRYACTTCYISYKTLSRVLGEKDEEIDKSYLKIKGTLIYDREDLEGFVVALNTFLVKDIVKKLLETSADIVREIYGGEEPTPSD